MFLTHDVVKRQLTLAYSFATVPNVPKKPKPELPKLVEAIQARREELGLYANDTDLAKAAGITRQGLTPVLAGKRKRYQNKLKWGICTALRWTPDSFDRMVAGADPIPLASEPGGVPTSGTGVAAQVAALEAANAALEAERDALVDENHQLRELLARREKRNGPRRPRASNSQ